jgi:hypothetical protein
MIGLSALPYWTQTRAFSQMPERVNGDVALDRALKTSSLTFQGKPFHAVMEVGTVGEEDSGRIEFWWANASKYHVTIHSPKFSRTKTVNGERAFEQNDGDFYPQWLETFVLAVLDPVPMEKMFADAASRLIWVSRGAQTVFDMTIEPMESRTI